MAKLRTKFVLYFRIGIDAWFGVVVRAGFEFGID